MSNKEQPPSTGKKKVMRAAAAAAATAAVAAAVTATGATAAAASTEAQDARPAFTVEQLDDMLASADLDNADNVRVVQALEVSPGAMIAKQYDR
ncbi:hypothetical protein ACFVW8_14095 [Streptomyces sp. NPDC058221]|uniref:hypothetical protein n=1 Tax=Streptomyces sp. NPDC058221 TaxID=3346388 RepID=UPI0036E5183D